VAHQLHAASAPIDGLVRSLPASVGAQGEIPQGTHHLGSDRPHWLGPLSRRVYAQEKNMTELLQKPSMFKR